MLPSYLLHSLILPISYPSIIISLTTSYGLLPLSSFHFLAFPGILGLIKLHSYEFLVVITSRTKTASLMTSTIYQATDFRVFPVSNQAKPSLLQHPIEKSLLGLLKAHLYSAPFYFSYDYDLTSSMQRQAEVGRSEPVWKRVSIFVMERGRMYAWICRRKRLEEESSKIPSNL